MNKILPLIIILALTPSASADDVTGLNVSKSGTVAELVHTSPNRIEARIRVLVEKRRFADFLTYCAFNQPHNNAISARTMAMVEKKFDPPIIEITEVVAEVQLPQDPLKKILILDNEQATQKQSNRLLILDQPCENN